jgi:hypothetical protein
MVRTNATPELDAKVARHFAKPPAQPAGWTRVHVWLGLEVFGRPASPWAALITPVPLAALMLLAVRVFAPPPGAWPWLADRVTEAAWVCMMPFVFATIAQAVAMAVSNHLWRETEGERHLDYSPRAWHYWVGVAIAALPLAALQLSPLVLDWYLNASLSLQVWLFPGKPVHVGYDPDPANLLVLGVLPLVMWQVRRLLARIPCGRLLGFQRELARLKGAVAWDQKAWGEMVGETFARWVADLAPSSLSREKARQHRIRVMNLQREVAAAYSQAPTDLARANRALATYRQGL